VRLVRRLAAACLMVTAGFIAEDAAGAEVTQIGQRFSLGRTLTAARLTEVLDAGAPGSEVRYLRIRIELRAGSSGRWYLTIRDRDLRIYEVLSPESFAGVSFRWTGRIPSPVAHFELELVDAPATRAVELVLDEYIAMPAEAEHPYYSIQGQDPTYSPLFSAPLPKRRLGDAVGFLMASHGQTAWCCSGTVVGTDLLLTNWHCGGHRAVMRPQDYWNPSVCRDTLVDLSWDDDQVSREFQCEEVLAKDQALDFALLRLRPVDDRGPARPVAIHENLPAGSADRLQIIHHPKCLPKQISTCGLVDRTYTGWTGQPDTDFTHRCDTENGSSGGPVFDPEGRLVGLHHRGFEDAGDDHAKEHKLNSAVRMDRILAYLRGCDGTPSSCPVGLADRLTTR
jgi:hypothetical protein